VSIVDDGYFLEHYGVKGMHWGIRKDPDAVDPVKSMSDAELRNIVNRARLENEYRQVTNSHASKTGRQFWDRYQHQVVKGVATAVGVATVAVITKGGPQAIRAAGTFFVKHALMA
jgi:L-serine deaminase